MQNFAVVFNEVMKWRTKETGMLEGRIENLYIIGSTGAVSDDVAAEAAYWSQMKDVRIAGKDRYETNTAVNAMFNSERTKSLCVATGSDFPDALVGGVLAGRNYMPVVFVNGKAKNLKLSDTQKEFLFQRRSGKVYVLGGEGAVPSSHVDTILKEMNG